MKYQLPGVSPRGREENIIQGEKWRFTLLTPRLIRMEYSEDGVFEDRPTQTVINRTFEPVSWRLTKKDGGFELYTDGMQISYDGEKFTKNGLSAHGQGGLHPYGAVWHYGENPGNLKGTARTLDLVDGACELQDGILSTVGCAVLDDSETLLLTEDGWVEPRRPGSIDLYLFMYGGDYEEALSDYYRLTGKTPMLPRYALGNWWSRYYEYTEESYRELVERFEREEVPFSVAVIDMDWHLVDDVDPKYGSSWTGFTWNKKLFPDPKRFLSWLHEKGMRTTLNLHPADGIRGYEAMYPQMAEAMGVDASVEEPVLFDIANREFLEAYFTYVMHPYEEDGVDFWWIDWQQGNNTKIPGLDPLWMLNHYHYLDSARDGKRPLTFSRYAGPGSHRYPVGFSGDTIMTWESLDFQPYFTNTASNIGYGWWSHDIGGHMRGYKDNEMAARWVQYGVFSPINRLHSSKSDFNGKEPWRYPMEIAEVMRQFLRLRHQMLPYLYTMNYRAHWENRPLIQPMYYSFPKDYTAYNVKNQYFFGTGLMVAPITTPQIRHLNTAKVQTWLPEGIWFDFFTGMIYSGGRLLDMYRGIHTIPVLARAGAIIPMTDEIQGAAALKNPSSLVLRVYGGADGAFTLYEDDNETMGCYEGDCVKTDMRLDWESKTFVIDGAKGNLSLVPGTRAYTVCLYGVNKTDVTVMVDGERVEAGVSYDEEMGCLTIRLEAVRSESRVLVSFATCSLRANPVEKKVFDFLNQAEIAFEQKERVYQTVRSSLSAAARIAQLQAMDLDRDLIGCVTELLTAWE
ncbi:MAG: DUF5110 domain-containing protein [Lachnospiraceae bacterium]|nr:DUF5110 domain-containing protein [Lachnospiraceae bacterium]